ncbi:DUF2986 domain-containing protein [Vibrio makurazakiensis]|uniref:DUF2986 domain-containing protein n=1 Tax=Vibrio makurazakiensis TaxID=2910250 RepID=UPI003D149A86
MNRKKKINDILKKKQKKANSKLHKSNKPRYISKADRVKMEAEEAQSAGQTVESNTDAESTVESKEA